MTSARSALFDLELFGIKLGLDQIRGLIAALDHPDRAFRSVVVAGTNGKGSVTAMIERGLRAAGYRTGRYTSPHLVHLEERIAVDGAAIAPEELERLAARVLDAARALPAPPTFFEATTAMALDAFRAAAVDVAVLEVGLGGRLDATNAVASVAEVITMIGFDHQQHLGHTIEAIAREKAGIIKPGTIVVLAANPPEVDRIVADAAAAAGAAFVRADAGTSVHAAMRDGRAILDLATPAATYDGVRLALAGRHQIANAITAVRLLEAIAAAGLVRMPAGAIRTALEDVVWPARLELRRRGAVDVLIDGAHNAAGARALAAHLAETYGRPLPIVLGLMQDKDAAAIVAALAPVAAVFVCTAAASPRAATPDGLAAVAARVAPDVAVRVSRDPMDAVDAAAAIGSPVVVAGSLYLAGQVRERLS